MISCDICDEEISADEDLEYYEGQVFHKDCAQEVREDVNDSIQGESDE